MDNRKILIQSEGRENFDLAIQLAFNFSKTYSKATHYLIHPEKGFVGLWAEGSLRNNKEVIYAIPFPTKLNWKGFADLAWQWLLDQPDSNYQEKYDFDGSNGKGFRVYNENWNRIADCWPAFVAILPVWAWYGK